MTIFYLVLFTAMATGVMQATLDKAGVGRIEATAPSALSNILVLLSIPISLLSNLGLIAIVIWSLFVLPLLPTLGVVAAGLIGFSLIWGVSLALLRRGASWQSVVAVGLPLVFALRLACSACIVFLVVNYVRGGSL